MSDAENTTREKLIEVLNGAQHAPMETHDGRTGECLQCPWPLHELGPDEIADALIAEFPTLTAAANAYPVLDVRYTAAEEYVTNSLQVTSDEVTERVRVELLNAFANGAVWQYGRAAGTETHEATDFNIDIATDVLTAHQRMDAQHCLCGWGALGFSHARHQAELVRDALEAAVVPGGTP